MHVELLVTGPFSIMRTGASRVPDRVTFQGIGNVGHFSQFFLFTAQLTSQSVGLHAAFNLLCQLLPVPFCAYAERVNFLCFVQSLPLQISCVSIAFYMLFLRKQQSQKSPLAQNPSRCQYPYIFNRLLTLFCEKWEEITFAQKCFSAQFIHFPAQRSVSQPQPLL